MEKKLVIFFVTNNYTPYQGGVVSSIAQSASSLRALGHTVKIITLDFGHTTDPTLEYDVIRLHCPVQFTYKTNPLAIPWKATTQIDRLVQRYKPDLMHVHHPFLLGQAAATVARMHKLPLLFTYHTRYEHYLHYCPLPQKISAVGVQYLVKKFCTYPQTIIAPTPSLRNDITGTTTTPIVVIPSSISPTYIQQKLPQQPGKKFHILTVSRFVQEKNIPFLIDAIAHLDPTRFRCTFAGYGQEYHTLQDYAFTTKKIPQDLLQFVHKPSKEILRDLYKNAHVFIFASVTETQGIVLAEAMASATPVIAYNAPSQQDIIQDSYNGFLVKDATAMQEKILLLAACPEQWQCMSTHAAQTAQQYTPATVTQKLIDTYYEALHSAGYNKYVITW